jgi:pSer/pThr/pTyr-binding forkhead associated (FHA) protein
MAKLILSMDGLVLKEITLVKERTSIGRKPNNDIQIDNLAISGEHARVVTLRDDSFLEDLNSTNGTLVNGQPVKKHLLRNGDVVELGKYKLKYVVEPAADAPGELGALGAPAAGDGVALGATVAAPASSALPSASIEVLGGAKGGRRLALSKPLTTLGKPGVQVAVIARRANGYSINHVEGSQVPLLNGRPISGQAQALADNDVIEIAGVAMKFTLDA